MNEYAKRDENLAQMGFANYGDYLKSDLWYWIRQRLFDNFDPHNPKGMSGGCYCCRSRFNLSVHHCDYSLPTLVGNSRRGLRIICSECHTKIEFLEDGSKATLEQANERMNTLRYGGALWPETDSPDAESA